MHSYINYSSLFLILTFNACSIEDSKINLRDSSLTQNNNAENNGEKTASTEDLIHKDIQQSSETEDSTKIPGSDKQKSNTKNTDNSKVLNEESNESMENIDLKLDLVGLWSFEDLDNEQKTSDSSGSSLNGHLSASGVSIVEGGVIGKAASFNGGYITLGSPEELNFNHNKQTTSYTLSAWVKTQAPGSIIAKRNSTIQYQLFVNNSPSGTAGAHIGTESTRISSSRSIMNGQWQHVLLRVKNIGGVVTGEFFINGVADVSLKNLMGTDINNDEVWLGGRPGGFFLNGMLDEVAIWKRSLNNTEIKSLHDAKRP